MNLSKPNLQEKRKRKDVSGLVEVMLTNKDSAMRREAAQMLREIGDPMATMGFIKALRDTDGTVVSYAISWLDYAVMDSEIATAVVEPLIGILKEKNPYLCGKAAEWLGKIGDEPLPSLRPKNLSLAVEPLKLALNDADESVRKAAAKALKSITR